MHRGTHTHNNTPHTHVSVQNHLEPISSACFHLSAQAGVWLCRVLISLLGFDRVSLESADRFFGLL